MSSPAAQSEPEWLACDLFLTPSLAQQFTLLETNMETQKGPIKTTVPLKWGYMGFHVSFEKCIPCVASVNQGTGADGDPATVAPSPGESVDTSSHLFGGSSLRPTYTR